MITKIEKVAKKKGKAPDEDALPLFCLVSIYLLSHLPAYEIP